MVKFPASLAPQSFRLLGKKPSRRPSYAYTSALKANMLPLTNAILARYIDKPEAAVPDIKMFNLGFISVAECDAIFAYLADLQ